MEFRLLRLILVDSYCRGKTLELKADGHITINGKNGAGKTTLLRLFPVFLGETPSKVVRGDDRFSTHYFPTTGSYIIYEYQRRDQKVLAVIHADGQQDGVVYRFIDSEYRTNLFRDEAGIVQAQDLARHLQKLGVFCSDRLTLGAYRKIIQNTAPREYRSLASRFSFVGSGGRIDHIERVITGILQRVTTFYDLRRMVVSAVREDGKPFTLSTVKKDLIGWLNEFQAHQAMLEKLPDMEALEQSDQRRAAIESDLSVLRSHFGALQAYLQGEVDRLEQAITSRNQAREEKRIEFEQRLETDRGGLAASRADLGVAQGRITTLDERQRQYQADKIEDKCSKVDSLPELEDKHGRLQEQLRSMDGVVQEIDKLYEQLKSEVKLAATEEKQRLGDAKSTIWEEFTKQRQAAHEAHETAKATLETAFETEMQELREREGSISGELGELQERVRNAAGDPQLHALLEQAEVEVGETGKALLDAHEQRRLLESKVQQAKGTFEESERQLLDTELRLEELQLQHERTLALAKAGDDTLLGYLRLNKPDWVGDIGRIVQEDLLLRTDLNPQIEEGGNLYGVAIALDHINASRLSSDEQIQRELSLSLERVKKAEAAVEEDKETLEKHSAALQQAQEVANQFTVAFRKAESAKEGADNKLKSLTRQYQESKRTAESLARQEHGQKQAALQSLRSSMQQAGSRQKQALREKQTAMDAQLRELESIRDKKLQEVATRQQKIDADTGRELKRLDQERDQSLKEKGIPADALASLRKQIEDASKEIKAAHEAVAMVAQYRSWLLADWEQRSKWVAAAERHQAEAEAQDRSIQRLEDERKAALSAIDQEIAELETSRNKERDHHYSSGVHLASLITYPFDAEASKLSHDRANTIEVLITRKNDKFKELNQAREALYKGVEEICRVMRTHAGTNVEQHYTTSTRDLGVLSSEKLGAWLEVCRSWYSQMDTNQVSVQQIGRTQAVNISTFWKNLSDFRNNVGSFSRQLRDSLAQGKLFESIEDVDVVITTDIDSKDYWPAVERFHYEFEAWHPQSQNSQPPKEMVEAAREVAAILNDDRGLSADPADLIGIKVSANVNGKPVTATNENELSHLSSNGLSYLVLSVVLVGFVNRIRRNQQVVVPFPVDELKDLDFSNAKSLLGLLANNQISLIAAFPDVDPDLAPLFDRNYKVVEGRRLGTVKQVGDSEEYELQEKQGLESANV